MRQFRWISLGLLILVYILVGGEGLGSATGPGVMLTKERVEGFLREHALRSGFWKPENIEVRVVSFQPVSLPPGQVNFRIVRPVQGITPGLQSFVLAADISGRETTRLWLRAEIKVFEDVVVTSFPLGIREIVRSKDVRLERRDISSLPARPFTQIDDVVGQQALRAIEMNEILTQKSVDRPKLMRRGSSVTLVYETGSLRVEAPGTAEENGKVGDLIQVKNPTSGKALRGLVIDSRTVRIN
jgi:flagella basal body P-ring formation protein FlgA